MGKITKVLPVAEHLLAAVRRLDAGRNLRGAVVPLTGRSRRTGKTRLVRSCGGRLVRAGEKRGDGVGNTKCGKGTKVVNVVDSQGTPLAVHLDSANRSEVKLIEPTLDNLQIPDKVPEHLLYDKAADSDPLRRRLLDERGIDLVCPHRKNRKRKPTQDGRACRRYKRRYKVERTHSWFHNFRRTIIRYETTLARYAGWIYLACALITLRRL